MRVATFNILHGRSPQDGRVDVDRFAAAVQKLDADVLGLQEVDRGRRRSTRADLAAVAAEAMGAWDYRFVATREVPLGRGEASYGIALLSRLPVSEWRVVRLARLSRLSTLRRRRGWSRLLPDEPRAAVVASVQALWGTVLVANTHLSYAPGQTAIQLRQVVQALTPRSLPAILLGDLNAEAALVGQVSGLDPLATAATFPAPEPSRQLDHILGRGLRVVEGYVGEAIALPLSDHLALTTEVEREAGGGGDRL